MLVGYEANNILRNGHELGDFGRELVSRIARRHVSDYRALLFSTRIKNAYKGYFSSYANISTYLPDGMSKVMPSLWMRYRLNPWLKSEKVKIFHGLNEELPYHIGRDIKTIITCYGVEDHHRTSLMDSILWKRRMKYSFEAADVIVAVSREVKQRLVDSGVMAEKIVVIGGSTPYEVTDAMVEQYYALYQKISGLK